MRLVTRFADDMMREMMANSHKSGWQDMTVRQLLHRAEQELGELRRAIEQGADFKTVRSEAADVGNFLAMLTWNACREAKRREKIPPVPPADLRSLEPS